MEPVIKANCSAWSEFIGAHTASVLQRGVRANVAFPLIKKNRYFQD